MNLIRESGTSMYPQSWFVEPCSSEFAATRTAAIYDSTSDVVSDISTSISNSSAPMSSSNTNGSQKPRLSPVDEGSTSWQHAVSQPSIDNNFVMVTPAPVDNPKEKYYPPRRLDTGVHVQPVSRPKPAGPGVIQAPHLSAPSSNASDLTFIRKKVGPATPTKSALTAMMASSGSTNPLAELYATVSGRGEIAATNVTVYFPRATEPSGAPMVLNVKKDATVEEVIGFALWTYWEEKWIPKLDEDLSGEDDPKWEESLSTVRWVLRIAEIDGEVDDDFPREFPVLKQATRVSCISAPDRMGKITRFNSEAYAIIEATPSQSEAPSRQTSTFTYGPKTVEQNKAIHEKMHKRMDKLALPGPNAPPTAISATTGSTVGSVSGSSYLGPSTGHGPQILLRIRIAEHADAVHVSTTIPVLVSRFLLTKLSHD
jgi:hypothetical protein